MAAAILFRHKLAAKWIKRLRESDFTDDLLRAAAFGAVRSTVFGVPDVPSIYRLLPFRHFEQTRIDSMVRSLLAWPKSSTKSDSISPAARLVENRESRKAAA